MKNIKMIIITLMIAGLLISAGIQSKAVVISVYEGSEVVFDDMIGYEELSLVAGMEEILNVEGTIRRQWCEAPEGRSPYEIIKNYENTIKETGGEIIFLTRNPQDIVIEEKSFTEYFSQNRKEKGLSTGNPFSHTYFPKEISEYLLARITSAETDVYLAVASGKGQWAAGQDEITFFELLTIEVEAMEMDMVTLESLNKGIEEYGSTPVYNIFFDTGQAVVKEESEQALKTTAEFLKENSSKSYLVVGHTDNAGDYEMNMKLSEARAKAVVEKLIELYGVEPDQLIAVGVGPASPLFSNSSEAGRAKNRRVEIVEM
jgi:outer membrane protein OmpA-like peptidoglycan-associated protein